MVGFALDQRSKVHLALGKVKYHQIAFPFTEWSQGPSHVLGIDEWSDPVEKPGIWAAWRSAVAASCYGWGGRGPEVPTDLRVFRHRRRSSRGWREWAGHHMQAGLRSVPASNLSLGGQSHGREDPRAGSACVFERVDPRHTSEHSFRSTRSDTVARRHRNSFA